MKKLISVSAVCVSMMLTACTSPDTSVTTSSGLNSSSSVPTSSNPSSSGHSVLSAGTVIGQLMGEGEVLLPSGYFFELTNPTNGIGTQAQVASKTLYYTSSDCSGTPYVFNSSYSGSVFQAYESENTSKLYFAPQAAGFLEIAPFSERTNYGGYGAMISFGSLATSGSFTLSFNGQSVILNATDSVEAMRNKILASITSIVAIQIQPQSGYGYWMGYQVKPQYSEKVFSISESTLKASGSNAVISATLTTQNTIPGACSAVTVAGLNMPLTPVMVNDPSVTGLSASSFALPITIK